MWRNEPRPDRHAALAVAMVTITAALGLATWATFTAIQDLPEEDLWRWDRIHEFVAVAVSWVVLMWVLVWAWFWRKPAPDEHTRPLPIGLLSTTRVLAVFELAFGEPRTKLSAMLLGGAFAAAVWVAFAVWGAKDESGEDDVEPPPTDWRDSDA